MVAGSWFLERQWDLKQYHEWKEKEGEAEELLGLAPCHLRLWEHVVLGIVHEAYTFAFSVSLWRREKLFSLSLSSFFSSLSLHLSPQEGATTDQDIRCSWEMEKFLGFCTCCFLCLDCFFSKSNLHGYGWLGLQVLFRNPWFQKRTFQILPNQVCVYIHCSSCALDWTGLFLSLDSFGSPLRVERVP